VKSNKSFFTLHSTTSQRLCRLKENTVCLCICTVCYASLAHGSKVKLP